MLTVSSIFLLFLTTQITAQPGLWTSVGELADKPVQGIPWTELLKAADIADPNQATVSDQNSNNNAEILAAAIVFARTGNTAYKEKVEQACQNLTAAGKPADRTLAWARETGAYALAADLVGYKPAAFKEWLHNMAETYVASDNRTLLEMFRVRPNNWGTMGFGSLCAIYGFLQDTTRLEEIREYWIQMVIGPKPADVVYGDDLSWHLDTGNLRLINPKGSEKQGLNIDGVLPDDMRRNGSFSNPPPAPSTSYHWETLQGIIMGARILDRIGLPIWAVADSAINRAVYLIQVDWENQYGSWKAEGDDLWMLPFVDQIYGTTYREINQERTWQHGKNVGWPYVIWDGILYSLTINKAGSGSVNPEGGTFIKDWQLDLHAIPDEGWRFVRWEGAISSTSNPFSIKMDADLSITAVFEKIPRYPIEVKINGQGAVNYDPTGKDYLEGTEVILTPLPDLGWVFSGWSGDTISFEDSLTVKVDSTIYLIATFEPLEIGKYELRLHTEGFGLIQNTPDSENNIYNAGTIITLRALPAAEIGRFIWWKGSIVTTENPVQVTMDRHMEITATFSGNEVFYGGSETGTISGNDDTLIVSTANSLPAFDDALYFAAISTHSACSIADVEGLGLVWSFLKEQAGGDNQSFISLWKAQGKTITGGPVSAKINNSSGLDQNIIIVCSYFGGVPADMPVDNLIGANSNGIDGASSGGVNVSGFSYSFQPSGDRSAVFLLVARDKGSFVPGEEFIVREDYQFGEEADTIKINTSQYNQESGDQVRVYGVFDRPVDYALICAEILPEISAMHLSEADVAIPENQVIIRNYPNPFNNSTTISYEIPIAGQVRIEIFDLTGKLVKQFENEHKNPGEFNVRWNGQNDSDQGMASGIYVCSLKTGQTRRNIKLLLIK